MSRVALLSAFCLVSSLYLSCVSALDNAATAAAGASDPSVTQPTDGPARPRTKIQPDAYPYGKPKEAVGVKFSEYQSLAVPSYILVAILLVFVVSKIKHAALQLKQLIAHS